MQKIRLIALDLDGTVFDDQKKISPRTMAAMEAAIRQGVQVVPATGRPIEGVPPEFLQMPGVRYALTSNGATVAELATGKTLVEQPFPPETALPLYDLLSSDPCLLNLFIDGKSYTPVESYAHLEELVPPELLAYFRQRSTTPDLRALLLENPDRIEKFSILYQSDALRDIVWKAVAERWPELEISSSLARNLEINAAGVNKGSGLLALAGYLGLAPEEVMACGDSGNDLAMLRAAGLGVAMGNATDEAKAAADVLTLDNNHDGVAAAIEAYVLNRG